MARAVRQLAGAIGAVLLLVPGAAVAQDCGNDASGFQAWLGRYKAKAASQGISQGTLASALGGITYDTGVIRLDRGQRSFKLSFEEFYARRAGPGLISRAKSKLAQHRDLLDRIEKRYGVPPAVIVSIWGLETNFGGDGGGNKPIVQSIATLAYDCRRSDFFRNELDSALRIIDRGDIGVGQMRGGWAGEIGPMQLLPSSFLKYAVDFDGDGRKNLFSSVPDMLASTANFLKSKGGWKAGQGWEPGSANYGAIQEWNKAEVYARTISVMSARVAGRG
jgi:lytic murein transglycosylase